METAKQERKEKKSLFYRFIHGVEVVGNKLPHPFYLFSILIVVAIILSVIFAGTSVTYEKASSSGAAAEMVTATVKNLLNKETITYVTQNMYSIYYNFSPMMMMGLLMLSIGLAEQVGLFGAVIKRTIAGAKPAFVFAIVSFIAINANTASNAGILGCTAVSAAVFASMGYNPWLGILLAYAAGNAGMSANVFVGNLDVLLSGINESVCSTLGIDTSTVHVLQNWYFMAACAIVLTVVFTFVTTKFVRGFIGEPKDLSLVQADDANRELTPLEHKALRNAGIAAIVYIAVVVAVCIPKNSFFRADDGSIVPNSPLLNGQLHGHRPARLRVHLPVQCLQHPHRPRRRRRRVDQGLRHQRLRTDGVHRLLLHLPEPVYDLRLLQVDDPGPHPDPYVLRHRLQSRADHRGLPHRRLRHQRYRPHLLRRGPYRGPAGQVQHRQVQNPRHGHRVCRLYALRHRHYDRRAGHSGRVVGPQAALGPRRRDVHPLNPTFA